MHNLSKHNQNICWEKLEIFTLSTKHQTTFFNCILNNKTHAPTPQHFSFTFCYKNTQQLTTFIAIVKKANTCNHKNWLSFILCSFESHPRENRWTNRIFILLDYFWCWLFEQHPQISGFRGVCFVDAFGFGCLTTEY